MGCGSFCSIGLWAQSGLIDISAIYSRNNKADSKRLPPPFLSDYRLTGQSSKIGLCPSCRQTTNNDIKRIQSRWELGRMEEQATG